MQTDYVERSAQHQYDREILIEPQPPISISHFTHVIRRYSPVILLSLAACALAYAIIAVAIYLAMPAEKITQQPFRLDFKGAEKGEYPNKTKFNIADIISAPVLTRVWRDDRLSDYVPFGDFSRSVFVLESNPQYEQLAAEYQSRLADPKLSPVDRERLQKDFESKAESIAKNEYTINLDRKSSTRSIPEPLARKVLLDTLNAWADFAVNQQHVIAYEVSVLSPQILTPSTIEQSDLIAAIEVLNAKTIRLINNVQRIEKLPGATLAHTPEDHTSLEEVRIRMDEIMRFQLEPLIAAVLHNSALPINRAATIQFLESQLAYDQRQLEGAERLADSIRDAIAMYQQPSSESPATHTAAKTPEQPKGNEAVMPQLSDTFLDRLVTMSGRAADAQYRQRVVEEYREAVARTIPMKQAVAYDTAVLNELRKPAGGSVNLNPEAARAQIEQSRAELAQLINKMNELFQIVSRNMTPSTQLFAVSGAASTRTVRSVTARGLALYGLLVLLIAFPLIVIFCLLHNRVHEEEATEDSRRQERKLASAETLP